MKTFTILLFVTLSRVGCRTAPKPEFRLTDPETNEVRVASYGEAVAAGEDLQKQMVGIMLDGLVEGEVTPRSKYTVKESVWRKHRNKLMRLAENSRADELKNPGKISAGNWGQWMPLTHCLLLSSDRRKVDAMTFRDERNFTGGRNYYEFGDDYKKWVDSWKAVESWEKPDNWTVPSDWLTVEEMERENNDRTSDFYVAQFRIRFCNNDLPKNGGKLCEGGNGLYETKVFYFQRPDNPDTFYSENISEYGDWCEPLDLIYLPKCLGCDKFFNSEEFQSMKLKTEVLKTKAAEKYKVLRKYQYKLDKSLYRLQFGFDKNKYKFIHSKRGDSYKTYLSRNTEIMNKYDKRLEEAREKVSYHKNLLNKYEIQIEENLDKINLIMSLADDARKSELWKTELKYFYGLD